jgi:hypothetical protein
MGRRAGWAGGLEGQEGLNGQERLEGNAGEVWPAQQVLVCDHGAHVRSSVRTVSGLQGRRAYVVSPDGQRFLMIVVEETASPIAVILNWKGKP